MSTVNSVLRLPGVYLFQGDWGGGGGIIDLADLGATPLFHQTMVSIHKEHEFGGHAAENQLQI